jgi:23S rRNA (cytidine1920-2'-O)/16S rRNA (cytidine1409-2'-O)-methyltransferase
VRDPAVHAQVIKKVWDEASQLGLSLSGLSYSPITGPEGNIEFLAWFRHGGQQTGSEDVVQQVVQESHDVLGKR